MEVLNTMKVRLVVSLIVFSFALASVPLFAQSVEVNPYASYYWPSNNNPVDNQVGDFKSSAMWGVRGGGYVTHSFEIGGNVAWLNRFQPSISDTAAAFAGALGFPQDAVKATLWEVEWSYNFGKRNVGGAALRPYLVLGTGGITTRISNNGSFVLNTVPLTPFGTRFAANDVLDSGDTFFTFSYGGGVKALSLLGPMGVFGDFRGRTIPNLIGSSMTYPELSAGLTFSWGEK